MKKLLLVLSCCMATWCSAQTFLKYDASSSASSNVPQKTVEKVSDGVIITYIFGGATITKDDLYTSSYNWNIQGFTANSTLANPAYLQFADQVEIPSDGNAEVTILESSYVDFNYELAPARPPLLENSTGYDKTIVKPIATYSGFRPKTTIAVDDVIKYRGKNYQKVILYPIRYNMQTKTVRACKKFKYKVTYGSDTDVRLKKIRRSSKQASNTTIGNKDVVVTTSYTPESYLIITSSKYASAANTLAAWKRLMGFKTFVISNSSWTTSAVRNIVKAYYNLYGIQYLLIVGDYEDIPAEDGATYSVFTTKTDYKYCCMDGEDDKVADIFRGRLSVSSAQEATNVVNKIINYEKNPVTDSGFYSKYLASAYFQTFETLETFQTTNARELRAFVQTMEELVASPGLSAKTPQREYYTEPEVYPTYYNNGNKIPTSLQKPNYPWTANGASVAKVINSGVFLTLYRGHGGWNRLHSVGFYNSHASGLTNKSKVPVMLNVTCLTGKFAGGTCLAETLLRNANGGAAAVLASYEVSFSDINNIFIKEIVDAFWPKNTSNEPVYRIGDAIDQGLAVTAQKYSNSQIVEFTKHEYHCFGDPSMMLTTEVPTAFSNVSVSRIGGKVTVSLPSGVMGQITLNDTGNDEVLTCYGNFATFTLTNSSSNNVQLCVSGHNKVPYITNVAPTRKPNSITGEIRGINANSNIVNVSMLVTPCPKIAYVEIAPLFGGYSPIKTEFCNTTKSFKLSVEIPSNYPSGMYYAKLYYNGTLMDTKKFTYGTSKTVLK